MRSEEYLRIATGDIADPARAWDAYRELKGHLEEAAAEVVGQGVDPETAALVAMARMGAPEKLSLSLAEAHHRHLPWRHYLTVLPLACLVVTFLNWDAGDYWRVGRWWLALLLFCLVPTRAALRSIRRRLEVDLWAKWQWLGRQPLRAALVAGGSAGIVAGVVSSTLPLWREGGFTTILLIPVLSAGAVLLLLRRLHTGPIMVTATFAALAFPVAMLPGLWRWWFLPNDWLIMWLFFAVLFGCAALAAAWIAQILQRKGWLPRT